MRPLSPLLLVVAATGLAAAAGCGGNNNGGSATASSPPPAPQTQTQAPAPTQTSTTQTSTTPSTVSGSSASKASAPVAITADPNGNLAYVQKSLSAKAGKATFHFTNQSSVPHGFTITGNGVNAAAPVMSGSSENLTVNLKPGKYTFFCPVPGHRQAGMQGTLTVTG
jgi:uncharacterized cupredoxin-like copper-binding protein